MCFGSREKSDGGGVRSRELDKIIRQDEKRMAKEVKLLLLGTLGYFTLRAREMVPTPKPAPVPILRSAACAALEFAPLAHSASLQLTESATDHVD